MAVSCVLRLTALATVTVALGNAGVDLERTAEDVLDLRVEPSVDYLNNSSSSSGDRSLTSVCH